MDLVHDILDHSPKDKHFYKKFLPVAKSFNSIMPYCAAINRQIACRNCIEKAFRAHK
jgi:hypothetical protein